MSRTLLFSERYSGIITDKNFSAEFTPEIYSRIDNCLFEFNEPELEQASRYNSWTIQTSACEKACANLFEKNGWPIDRIGDVNAEWLFRQGYAVTFDLIELWFDELSEGERGDFQTRINDIFEEDDQPWMLVDGKLIRIDPTQFERDLQLKHIDLLQKMTCSEPIFKSALDEYVKAIESFNKGEYKTCVLEAEKSYESVLKIICRITSGTADVLLNSYLTTDYVKDIPSSMKANGFKDNVLNSLPYIRNHTNAGHGDGMTTVQVSKPMAKLSLNLCSSLCTYMIELYLEMIGSQSVDDDADQADELPF